MNSKTKSNDHVVETSVSVYDVVNAFLISSLVVVGTIVGIMFLIWLTMIMERRRTDPPALVVDPSFGNEKPEGFADDIYEPGVEEFPEVDTPQLADALEALNEAVSAVKANLEARDGDAAEMGKGSGFGSREGGPGSGDSRAIPEYQRWKIEYDTPNINEYARQLSFFDIDIGVVSNASNDVIRVQKPGNGAQLVQTDRDSVNSTLFFVHEKIRLRKWDELLAKRSNVDLREKFTVQFYPESTRNLLRQVEAAHLQQDGREVADVRRTRFKVIEDGNGFAFRIASVDYQ